MHLFDTVEKYVASQGYEGKDINAAIINPVNPYQLLTASLDGDIKIWDYLEAVLLQTIRIGHPISHMCAHEKFKGHVFIAVLTKLQTSKLGASALSSFPVIYSTLKYYAQRSRRKEIQ